MGKRSSLGSIQKLPDKRFKVTVTIGYTYTADGKKKQRRKSHIVNSMREARAYLQEHQPEPVDKNILLSDYIKKFLERKKHTCRASTVDRVRALLNHLQPLFGRKIASIQDRELNDLISEQKLSPSTMGSLNTRVRELFRSAYKDGYISRVPEIEKHGNKLQSNTMLILPTMDEIRKIMEVARQHFEETNYHTFLYPFVMLILATGMRVGEVCGLYWSDIDFKKSTIAIRRAIKVGASMTYEMGDMPKNQSSIRIIPVPESVLQYIHEHVPQKHEYVFYTHTGRFMIPPTISLQARKLFRKCGYPKLRLYDFRHIHATELIARGVDIKSVSHRLGHANPMITLTTYTHYVSDNDQKAADLMDEVLKKCLFSTEKPKKP